MVNMGSLHRWQCPRGQCSRSRRLLGNEIGDRKFKSGKQRNITHGVRKTIIPSSRLLRLFPFNQVSTACPCASCWKCQWALEDSHLLLFGNDGLLFFYILILKENAIYSLNGNPTRSTGKERSSMKTGKSSICPESENWNRPGIEGWTWLSLRSLHGTGQLGGQTSTQAKSCSLKATGKTWRWKALEYRRASPPQPAALMYAGFLWVSTSSRENVPDDTNKKTSPLAFGSEIQMSFLFSICPD